MTCLCTLDTRCAVAWDIHDALRAHPVDGTPLTTRARRDLIWAYTRHLREAGLSYYHGGSTAMPLWSDGHFPDPRTKGARS